MSETFVAHTKDVSGRGWVYIIRNAETTQEATDKLEKVLSVGERITRIEAASFAGDVGLAGTTGKE